MLEKYYLIIEYGQSEISENDDDTDADSEYEDNEIIESDDSDLEKDEKKAKLIDGDTSSNEIQNSYEDEAEDGVEN